MTRAGRSHTAPPLGPMAGSLYSPTGGTSLYSAGLGAGPPSPRGSAEDPSRDNTGHGGNAALSLLGGPVSPGGALLGGAGILSFSKVCWGESQGRLTPSPHILSLGRSVCNVGQGPYQFKPHLGALRNTNSRNMTL